jgi:hypothetical protein
MKRVGVLGVAICAAVIGYPCVALAQEDVIVAPEPAAAFASLTPIADAIAANAAALAAEVAEGQDATARPVAIEYSDGHLMRGKIHKYASFATLPLFATEYWLGQSLYNDPQSLTSGKRAAHGTVGAALISLFAVNSVTGVWNLLESRAAPGHTKRLVHGLLMLASEGGLIASAASAPGHSRSSLVNFDVNKATHRNIAVVSIGVGTAGYLFMLFSGGS